MRNSDHQFPLGQASAQTSDQASSQVTSIQFELMPADNQRLANLCGPVNQHLHQIADFYHVKINCRSNQFEVSGEGRYLKKVKNTILTLYNVAGHETLSAETVQLYLNDNVSSAAADADDGNSDAGIKNHRGKISGRGKSQQQYLEQIKNRDLTIGVGPAGTGKTYLAVASAVEALESDLVDRLILVRPAVEAGERLGFLPGDLAQKIDPYLRPMYDALFEMLGQQKVAKYIERNIIEIAPLAYMRGRTLNDAFIILDEAQNTTVDQMKMFLTRIGFGSKAVVTGDITQVDLPRDKTSGLRHALKILSEIEDVGITQFHKGDIVRHPLVKKIVHAYEKDESK
ncbi:Phosphate starvation-inducible protein PhoH, predicted ATPase [hydrothermal vent metagenome]|uniref:PhoH-like protein n=1 Tax=hydrothermal vent metagenome TaxID=652676 RepID=A0A3B0WW92_9ZZZZ